MERIYSIRDGSNGIKKFEPNYSDRIQSELAAELDELGRRNLSPIQRIAVTEKYRSIYERQAKENTSLFKGNQHTGSLVNLPTEQKVNTSEKLSSIAGVSEKTYRMGAKVLDSNNEDIKSRVLSGETSIN